MPIIKIRSSQEKYRSIAKNHIDPHQLNGRGDNKKYTEMRMNYILKNITNFRKTYDNVIDIGCGDGNLLKKFSKIAKSCIGILPSLEEKKIVEKLVKPFSNIKIIHGLSNKTSVIDNSADLVICNSVLHGIGFNKSIVEESLKEFYKKIKKGGILYVGEIPNKNEMEGRNYGISFFKYLIWATKNRGLFFAFEQLKEYFFCLFSKKGYTIQPPEQYYCSKSLFVDLLEKNNYKVVAIYDFMSNEEKTHARIDLKTRLDYLCIKE